MTRKLTSTRYEEIRALAADLIEDYGLIYPLEPLEIADALGVQVLIHADGLPSVLQRFLTSDGYTEPVASRHGWKFRIHINGAKPALRQRFTLMHELSHVWLDHVTTDATLSDERVEGEANFLANYLLAPDILVLQWVPGFTISHIAEVFHMSVDAAELTHARVLRAINQRAICRPHDQRILKCANRRVELYAADLSAQAGLA